MFRSCLSLVAVSALWAQDSGPQRPTISVTTRLVEINVVVRDKRGPVPDLTQGDFTVLVNGKRRDVAFFSVSANPGSAKTAAIRPDPPAPPPAVVTNRPGPQAAPPGGVTVILLDGINTTAQDQVYAKEQVVRFLRQIRPEDRVAIYSLGYNLRVLQDFTGDASQLVRALAAYRPLTTSHLDTSNPRPIDLPEEYYKDLIIWLEAINEKIAGDYRAQRARLTMSAMEAIANHVSRVPGRKNLVWVTGSFPFSTGVDKPVDVITGPVTQRRSFEAEAWRAIQAINNANLAVYPVDARALLPKPGEAEAAKPILILRKRRPNEVDTTALPDWDTLDLLAQRTGGRAFVNTNDIQDAVRAAVEDAEVTYNLGFYPDSAQLDSRFHNLKVQVRRSGVELRYRKGYYAIPVAAPTEQQRADQIKDAFWSPLDAAGITLSAQRESVPGSSRITLTIDPADIALQQQAGRWTGAMEIVFSRQSADGRDLGTTSETARLNLEDSVYQQLRRQGFVMVRSVAGVPGLARVRIIVYDHTTGRIGSVRVEVPQ